MATMFSKPKGPKTTFSMQPLAMDLAPYPGSQTAALPNIPTISVPEAGSPMMLQNSFLPQTKGPNQGLLEMLKGFQGH